MLRRQRVDYSTILQTYCSQTCLTTHLSFKTIFTETVRWAPLTIITCLIQSTSVSSHLPGPSHHSPLPFSLNSCVNWQLFQVTLYFGELIDQIHFLCRYALMKSSFMVVYCNHIIVWWHLDDAIGFACPFRSPVLMMLAAWSWRHDDSNPDHISVGLAPSPTNKPSDFLLMTGSISLELFCNYKTHPWFPCSPTLL